MQAATVLSLILGGLGATSGTSALLMQWRERRRKLLVVSTWLTAGYVENKVDYLLLLEVVNPTLEPVKLKAAGVFWAANQEMLFPLRPESGRRYKQPDHYTYDDDGLQYEATIPGRGSQETYGYVSDLIKQIVSAWETMAALRDRTDEAVLELATIIRATPYPWERPRMVQLWPFCADPLGKKFWPVLCSSPLTRWMCSKEGESDSSPGNGRPSHTGNPARPSHKAGWLAGAPPRGPFGTRIAAGGSADRAGGGVGSLRVRLLDPARLDAHAIFSAARTSPARRSNVGSDGPGAAE